jgi:protein gp37
VGRETKIPWCDSTINPVVGCDGCELHRAGAEESHCYAAGLVGRYAGCAGWPASFDKPEFFAGRLDKACRWSDLAGKDRPDKPWLNGYPRTIFLGDLADVFSESLPIDWMAPHLPAMAAAPHIWIICTKRPGRAREFFGKHGCPPNFWLLTTVTGPATLNRVTELLRIGDVTVLGVSAEPLLAATDLHDCYRLNWVIVGGESGPRARPMHPQWARDIRDRCVRADTPFFFKQHGEWLPVSRTDGVHELPFGDYIPEARFGFLRGRKGSAEDALLDGRQWHQMPPEGRR